MRPCLDGAEIIDTGSQVKSGNIAHIDTQCVLAIKNEPFSALPGWLPTSSISRPKHVPNAFKCFLPFSPPFIIFTNGSRLAFRNCSVEIVYMPEHRTSDLRNSGAEGCDGLTRVRITYILLTKPLPFRLQAAQWRRATDAGKQLHS